MKVKAAILKVRWFGRKQWGRRHGPFGNRYWRHCRGEGPDVVYHYDGLSAVDHDPYRHLDDDR